VAFGPGAERASPHERRQHEARRRLTRATAGTFEPNRDPIRRLGRDARGAWQNFQQPPHNPNYSVLLLPDQRGGAVPVVVVHQGPSLTQERYSETVRKLTGGKSRMEKPEDWPVEGLLVHTAGQGDHGFRVVDVWESEEAARRFGDRLTPVLKEVGIEEPLEVYPVYTFVSA
jgi:hypothetical protein